MNGLEIRNWFENMKIIILKRREEKTRKEGRKEGRKKRRERKEKIKNEKKNNTN